MDTMSPRDAYSSVSASTPQQPQQRTSRAGSVVTALFFSALFFLVGYLAGQDHRTPSVPFDFALVQNGKGAAQVDFALFWKVWDLLKEKYVDHDTLDAQDMVYGAINGMLAATGDPYTVFLDPEDYAALNEELSGSFEGIGAEIGIKDSVLTIVAPLDDSPAQQAGLRAGDKVIEIEGESTAGITADEAVKKMRGAKGTELHMKIVRINEKDEAEDPRDVTVVRDTIHIKSVRVEYKDDNIAHIRISQFGEDTITEFNRAVADVQARKVRGVVVDVRNDPGGILHVVTVIASKFLPERSVVVIEQDAQGKRTNLYTTGKNPLATMPTVVLMNEGSASASEILAGALRDNRDDVTLVGKKTFGKGSVQELIPTSATTAAKITVAKWLTPSGEQINDTGIAPDVEVEYTSEDYEAGRDPQLDRAVEVLKEKIAH